MLRTWSTTLMLLVMMSLVTGCASLPLPDFLKGNASAYDDEYADAGDEYADDYGLDGEGSPSDDDFSRDYASSDSSSRDEEGWNEYAESSSSEEENEGDAEEDLEDVKEMAALTGGDSFDKPRKKRKPRRKKSRRSADVIVYDSRDESDSEDEQYDEELDGDDEGESYASEDGEYSDDYSDEGEYDDYAYEEDLQPKSRRKDLAKEAYKVPEDDELSRFLRDSLKEDPLLPQEKGGLSSFSDRDKLPGEDEALMVDHVSEYTAEEVTSPVDSSRNARYESTPISYKERRLAQQWNRERAGGFFRLRSDCNMRSKPRGAKLGVLSAGRRLWTSPHNAKWLKVYRKKGVAYISKACI